MIVYHFDTLLCVDDQLLQALQQRDNELAQALTAAVLKYEPYSKTIKGFSTMLPKLKDLHAKQHADLVNPHAGEEPEVVSGSETEESTSDDSEDSDTEDDSDDSDDVDGRSKKVKKQSGPKVHVGGLSQAGGGAKKNAKPSKPKPTGGGFVLQPKTKK